MRSTPARKLSLSRPTAIDVAPPILILGCQRSGTTLLGQILGAHSQTFMIDEPDGVYDWFDAIYESKPPKLHLADQAVARAAVKYQDSRQNARSMKDIASLRVVCKTPNLSFKWQSVQSMDKQPACLFLVRDVRAVALSMMKLKEVPMVENQTRFISEHPVLSTRHAEQIAILQDPSVPKHIKCAHIWAIKSGLIQDFIDAGLNPLLVPYESLVENPDGWAETIASHCGLPFETTLLSHHQHLKGEGPGNTRRERRIDRASRDTWRTELSPETANEIAASVAAEMSNFGYD